MPPEGVTARDTASFVVDQAAQELAVRPRACEAFRSGIVALVHAMKALPREPFLPSRRFSSLVEIVTLRMGRLTDASPDGQRPTYTQSIVPKSV